MMWYFLICLQSDVLMYRYFWHMKYQYHKEACIVLLLRGLADFLRSKQSFLIIHDVYTWPLNSHSIVRKMKEIT